MATRKNIFWFCFEHKFNMATGKDIFRFDHKLNMGMATRIVFFFYVDGKSSHCHVESDQNKTKNNSSCHV
jgi:hypothetical protein